MRHRPTRHRATTLARLAIALGALAGTPAHAAEGLVTEVFTIGYRPLEEVIPLVKSLVPPPGSVGGIGDQLVVRTSRENMVDIRDVLAAINRAPANLLISVRSGTESHSVTEGVETYGTRRIGEVEIGSGKPSGDAGLTVGDASSGVRIVRTRGADEDRDVQRVRVLEGREAFIRSGRAVPVADGSVIISGLGITTVHEGVRYEDVTRGFYVRPRLAGDQVTLEIHPHRERMSREGGGAIDIAGASTVVSGRLGEWMAIGGITEEVARKERGIAASTRTRSGSEYDIYVRVERLD
jgi:type II secretory pathway component GspD/PulD (secretin)